MSSTASALAMFDGISAFAGQTVTFTRGTDSVDVTAVPGKSTLEFDDGSRGRIEVESADWMILTTSLVLSGAVVRPQEGDRITFQSNGTTLTYELMTPPYRPSDNAGNILRLHSKQIA